MMEFTPENKKRFEAILMRYPTKLAALLPTLWLAQDQFGYISNECMEYVAHLLETSPVHVYSVTTFYTMFHRRPVGKYHLQVCRTLSCALAGSENILNHLKTKLEINEGEISKNGKFSLCTMECLASCDTGPAMMVNEKYVEKLTVEKVDRLIQELK